MPRAQFHVFSCPVKATRARKFSRNGVTAALTLARIWVCALTRIVAGQCVLFSGTQSVFGHVEFTNSSRNA